MLNRIEEHLQIITSVTFPNAKIALVGDFFQVEDNYLRLSCIYHAVAAGILDLVSI